MVEIERAKITPAPYNPRKIDELARKKLEQNIKTVGLVQPLIWNKRTGHLVGGHQRLEIIDGLKKSKDYTLQVAAIDVDEIKERELNVFLNNQSAQGDWDPDRLGLLLKTESLTIEATGFDRLDLELILDDQMLVPLFASENDDAKDDIATLTDTAKDAEFRKKRAGARKNAAIVDDTEFYTCLVFNSRAECEEFAKELDIPDDKFVNGRLVMEKFRALKGNGNSDPKSD